MDYLKTQKMPDYIFDTTALSNFAFVGKIELLEKKYYGCAYTTIEVSDELRRGVKSGYYFLNSALEIVKSVNPDGWIRVLSLENPEEYSFRYKFDQVLDPGEASCLALAVSKRFVFVTDDLAARRIAEKMNVQISGTLGVLISLTRQGFLNVQEANIMLERMRQGGFRSPFDTLDEYI